MASRRFIQLAAAGAPLFSPWRSLSVPIAMAQHDVQGLFEATENLINDGYSVKQAIAIMSKHYDHVSNAMEKAIYSSLMHGYKEGAGLIGKPTTGSEFRSTAKSLAKARASDVSGFMNKVTRKGLKKNPDNAFLTSDARAERAVKYEVANHYYAGLLRGAGGRLEKAWLTTSSDPCPECIENEDAGWLPLTQEFPSGHQAPLLHLSCACILSLQPA